MIQILDRIELELVQTEWGSSSSPYEDFPWYEDVAIWADPYLDEWMGDSDERAFEYWNNGEYGAAATEWAWGWAGIVESVAHTLTIEVVETLTDPDFWVSFGETEFYGFFPN